MKITIENNQVVVNLDEFEFPVFEAMFENLELDKFVRCEFRDFSWGSGEGFQKLLPMHLCRTIGEVNLSEDPFFEPGPLTEGITFAFRAPAKNSAGYGGYAEIWMVEVV